MITRRLSPGKLKSACCLAAILGSFAGARSAYSQTIETNLEYSEFEFIRQQILDNPPKLDVPHDPKLVKNWQKAASQKFRELLRVDKSIAVPLNSRIVETAKRDGYRIERIIFSSEKFADVPAIVLIPDGVTAENPAPAVLTIHGTIGGAKDEVAGETSNPAAARGLEIYGDDYGRQLVKMGFITITIDLRNFGERKFRTGDDKYDLNTSRTALRSIGLNALFNGRTYFGENVFDLMRAIDYLETRPDVKKDSIGCVGFSMGGNLAAWTAALDRRIKAVAIAGNWSSWRRLAARDLDSDKYQNAGKPIHFLPHMTYQVIPDFFTEMDMNISIAVTAPTPMIMAFEYENWQFEDLKEAKQDTEPITRAYKGFGAQEDLKIEFVKGKHHWRKEILPWFTDKLR